MGRGPSPAAQDDTVGEQRGNGRDLSTALRLLEMTSGGEVLGFAVRGCRPFSAEKEPLALSPGAPNPFGNLRPQKLESFL